MVSKARQHRGSTRRGRLRLLAAALLTLLCLLLSAQGAAAHGRILHHIQPHAQHVYLALGDSLAFGYSQARFEANLPAENPEAFDTGYVDDFGAALRLMRPHLLIVNDGCPGETTSSMVEGPCAYQLKYPLHHPYAGGPGSSQLSDALSFLASHRGQVNPITIDIGANDALGVVEGVCNREAACIAAHAPALFAEIAGKLALILADLRSAAPHAQIIVLGLYDPFGSSIEGARALTAQLNEVIAAAAARVDARFADPLPLFNPPGALEASTICLLTNMCTAKPDIHPTDLGYRVLAGAILRQYLLALPGKGDLRMRELARARRIERVRGR